MGWLLGQKEGDEESYLEKMHEKWAGLWAKRKAMRRELP
jgi:hypothetical protein